MSGMTAHSLLSSINCLHVFGTRSRAGRTRHRICCYQSSDKQTAKQNLKLAIGPTQRGGSASLQQRGVILEAQVASKLSLARKALCLDTESSGHNQQSGVRCRLGLRPSQST